MKIVLALIYIVLILLLFFLQMCERYSNTEPRGSRAQECADTVATDIAHPVTPSDSATLIREAERIGNSGALKVTLLWEFKGDLDLHVKEPNNTELFYRHKKDEDTGGFLDVDNTQGGEGAAENIFWADPPAGTYNIAVEFFAMKDSPDNTGQCSVVIFQEGQSPRTYSMEMTREKQVWYVTDVVITR